MLSAVILTKNEEKTISNVLTMLRFCDEILLIDNGSTDKTVDLAKKAGATVHISSIESFAERRNLGMEKAKGDWILCIDADEILSDALIKEIKAAVAQTDILAYYLRREDQFWGKPVRRGELQDAYQKGILRLMKKGTGTWVNAVHEEFITDQPTGRLETPLTHFSHTGIKDFLDDINFYSTIRAQELFRLRVAVSSVDILIRPFLKFVQSYFLKGGYRDGAAGFVYSFMMSFHSFLVRSKLYLLEAK
jgi:glycosyltransferase involved in cell wall biosynthesis